MENIENINNSSELDLDYLTLCAEAALFASGGAVEFDRLALSIGIQTRDIPAVLSNLKKIYDKRNGAISLYIMENSAVFATKKEYAEVVKTALNLRKNQPLSKAALEVLAVIAYNQPTTRAFVDKVRGVESPSVVSSLCEKGLIEEVGRLEAPGRPVLFGTTPVFLRTFGLSSVKDLVTIPEIAEYMAQLRAQNELELASIEQQSLFDEQEQAQAQEAQNEEIENSEV